MTVYIYVTVPIATGSLLAAIVYLVLHPEKADRLAVLLCRLARFACWGTRHLRRRVERQLMAADIQARINAATGRLTRIVPGAAPHAVRVEFVGRDNVTMHLRSGEILVRLRPFEDQDQNMVNATLAYLGKGLLPRTRPHLDSTLVRAIDYQTAVTILGESRRTGAVQHFVSSILEPALAESGDLRHLTQQTNKAESLGYFSRIFLSELAELGNRLVGALPAERVKHEARGFLEFVSALNEEDTALDYRGQSLAVAVMLVAEIDKLKARGVVPYVRRIRQFVRDGTPSIYVCGMGETNVAAVKAILRETRREHQIAVLGLHDYALISKELRQVPGIVASCAISPEFEQVRARRIAPVEAALRRHVAPIRDGRWEIAAIEVWPEHGSKAAVRIRGAFDPYGDVAEYLTSDSNRADLQSLQAELGGEPVHFIAWSPFPEELIISALRPWKRSEILRVDLDQKRMQATVWVQTGEARTRLIGADGWNVLAAGSLSGWDLDLQLGDARLSAIAGPTVALTAALETNIPELLAGSLRVEGLAREPGVGSKVVVRAKRGSAVQTCLGRDGSNLRAITAELREHVRFVEWSDDPAELVTRALYPLERGRIRTIVRDDSNHAFSVTVADDSALAEARGPGGANLRLAEGATGWKIAVTSATGVGKTGA